MHAGLWVLRRHVEPDCCCHGQVTVLVDNLGLVKKIESAVVRAWCKDVRKLAIVVVPRKLEGSTTIVLLSLHRRPGGGRPASIFIVAARIAGALAADLFHIVKSLSPVFTFTGIAFSSFLGPMG